MKLLFDLLPVLLFFVSYKMANTQPEWAAAQATDWFGMLVSGGVVGPQEAATLWATVIAILATLLQITYLKWRRQKIDTTLWLSFLIITVFGGATVWLHNETFIKWKPTVLYWLFAGVLLSSWWGWDKNWIRTLLGSQLQVPDKIWQQLNYFWAVFFAFMGAVNLYVAYAYPTGTWVNFKLFGLTGATLIFIVLQAMFLSRHVARDEPIE